MSNCSNIYANSALQCDYISFPLLKRNSPRLYRFKKMLKENSLRRNDLNNTTGVKEASTKSKPSILKETRKMSTFPWLNHGSLIQSRSVWTEACAGAEGSARDIAERGLLNCIASRVTRADPKQTSCRTLLSKNYNRRPTTLRSQGARALLTGPARSPASSRKGGGAITCGRRRTTSSLRRWRTRAYGIWRRRTRNG